MSDTLSASALQQYFEDLVLGAIRAGDYSKPDGWFALNARVAFSFARKAAQAERNTAHCHQAAQDMARRRSPYRSVEALASANVGADAEERL